MNGHTEVEGRAATQKKRFMANDLDVRVTSKDNN